MGNMCMRYEPPPNPLLPLYESLCSEIEADLKLSSIDIEKFEEAINIVCYPNKAIDNNTLAKVYTRFGVGEDTFLDIEKPFIRFFDMLAQSGDRRRIIIMSMLPFCNGSLERKKRILWVSLDLEKENLIYRKLLTNAIHTFIILSTKIIPTLVAMKPKYKANPVTDLQALLECDEDIINEYAEKYLPPDDSEDANENDTVSDSEKVIKRGEYEQWFGKISAEHLFSSTYHRKALLRHITVQDSVAGIEMAPS